MSEPDSRFFQIGGAVRHGGFYASRSADRELPEGLLRGEFCYVLAPRQIGKSSLRVRTKQRLEAQGIRCVSIDLTTIGSRDSSTEQWYFGILDEIAEQLALGSPDAFWQERALNSAVHRLSLYFRHVVLAQVRSRITIFIDELDAVLSQPGLQRDDFFAAVRACYNARAEDPEYERLTFCLMGVALPSDLIVDETRTPFNIGRCISLNDFTRTEINEFLPGLAGTNREVSALLDEIFAWTSGHPYMTQKLCQALALHEGSSAGDEVEQAVHALFVRKGRILEPNLAYAEKCFDKERRSPRALAMLRLYGRLYAGEKLPAQAQDPTQMALRLTGMAREEADENGTWLTVRNRVFAAVFDSEWVHKEESSLMFAEPLHRWLQSKRSDDYVLRGQALELARLWARGQPELRAEEGAFLLASLDVAEREEAERRKLAEALQVAADAAKERARWQRQVALTRGQQRNIVIVTEAWERFGYYLTLILLLSYLSEGLQFSPERARQLYGIYVSLSYLAPVAGGLLADRILGHRWAVSAGALLLTVGYTYLALLQRSSLHAGLALLVIGHGLFKPSISALLGVLYREEEGERDHAFGLMFIGINTGALAAAILGTVVKRAYGYGAAFGIGAAGMLMGFIYFSISSRNFAWTPLVQSGEPSQPARPSIFNKRLFPNLLLLLLASTLFWIAFLQNGQPPTTWVQANSGVLFGGLLLGKVAADSMNCLFIVLLGPVILYLFRHLGSTGHEPATTSKINLGMALTAGAFALLALRSWFAAPSTSISTTSMLTAILILSLGELCVSPMALSLIAKLTPPRTMALTMGCWFIAHSAAGLVVRAMTMRLWPVLPHAQYYAGVCAIALVGGVLFALQLRRLTGLFIQSRRPENEG